MNNDLDINNKYLYDANNNLIAKKEDENKNIEYNLNQSDFFSNLNYLNPNPQKFNIFFYKINVLFNLY